MIKVQLFWEGHKNAHNRPYGFEIYFVNVKIMGTTVQMFVAFSENMNFNSSDTFRHKKLHEYSIQMSFNIDVLMIMVAKLPSKFAAL